MRCWFCSILLAFSACTSSVSSTDAGSYVGCSGDKRVNVSSFPATIGSDSSSVQLKFTAADPAIPLSGENTWTVEVIDGSGNSLSATSISATAFMPDHGHPSPTTPQFTKLSDGSWRAEGINLFMAGVWRLTFTVKLTGKADSTAVAFVCVQG